MALRKTSTISVSPPETLTITSTYDDFKASYPSAPGWINPAGIAFRTNVSPNGFQLDADFGWWFWDFDVDGADPFAIYNRLPAWFPWGNNANVSNSPFPVHTYKNPGTYKVGCTYVSPTGQISTAETTVEIVDRDLHFTAAEVFCVSPSSDFTDAPAGSTQVTGFAGAFSTLTGGKDRLILLHLGETHTMDDVYQLSPSPTIGGGHVHMISTYGSGSDPAVIDYPNGTDYLWFRGEGQKAIFGNIKFQGTFDPTDESGYATTEAAIKYEAGASYLTVDGISTVGMGNGSNQQGGDFVSKGIVITNSLFTDWMAVCHYHANVRNCGHAGVLTLANPDGMGGGSGRSESDHPNATARHGPYRFIQQYQCSLENIYTFTNAGWGIITNGAGGYPRPVHQAHIRANTNGYSDCSMYVGKHVAEGGYAYCWSFASGGANAIAGDTPGDYLYEDFKYIGSANTTRALEVGFPGTLMRNFTVTFPNVPPEISSGPQYLANPGTGTGLNTPSDGAIPIRFQNGTIIDLRDATNGPDQRILLTDSNLTPQGKSYTARGYDAPIFTGMAFYAPNITTPDIADGPFDTTELVAALYKGLQHKVIYSNSTGSTVLTPAQSLDTDYETPAGTISLYQPATGAGVLDDQTTDIPLRDLLGVTRGNPTARGAYDDVAV